MTIDTLAGIVRAEANRDQVKPGLPPPADWRIERSLKCELAELDYGFVNTGVPHVVVPVDDVDPCDVMALGRAIRNHEDFAPAGANVNFMQSTGPQSIRVRTYERGVEAETLACGTGIVASALIAAKLGQGRAPIDVSVAGGDLTVDFRLTDTGAEEVTLLGPAVHTFNGKLEYPGN